MANIIYTPARSILGKLSPGISDAYIDDDGVLKFMGCTVLSINMSLGFNGTASSVSVTLVEDTVNGDKFVEPRIPSLWAISLPKGGVGAPIFVNKNEDLQPDFFFPSNTPFYFSGVCTNFRKGIRDTGGQTIQVTLSDPREVLNGVQCILSGFSLSREIGTGGRYLDVKNIIDVFGYWNNGLESDRNEYGMPWYKVIEVLSNVRVTLHVMNFEFFFDGVPFTKTPNWYRIDEQVIDIIALSQKVTEDAGADLIVVGRKVSPFDMVVELRSISRNYTNPIGLNELNRFIKARGEILESATIGREFKNEATGSIVVGGMQNSNYLALPSTWVPEMHTTDGFEDYEKFPTDIKKRIISQDIDGVGAGKFLDEPEYDKVKTGAIFPFWGTTPDDFAVPLVEPFLPLEHLAFDRNSEKVARVTERIPACLLETKMIRVREVPHATMFLQGDGDADLRPFAYVKDYVISAATPLGYIRGIPLNTEVLRGALISEEAFYNLYSLYYPDVADSLGFPRPDWTAVDKAMRQSAVKGRPDLRNVRIEEFLYKPTTITELAHALPRDIEGKVQKSVWDEISLQTKFISILEQFRTIIYEQVHEYATEHIGRRFIVTLPRSAIMERIWAGLPVPTRPERPEIEYMVADRGYWKDVPAEFDGILTSGDPNNPYGINEEEQIRRRFMAEDGRFYPMAVIEWRPKGNINFNSNGTNRAMFQDLPASEFRPNRIAEGNPTFVFSSCSVNQLVKRPDLALLELPAALSFDPTVGINMFDKNRTEKLDDEFIATKSGIMKYFWYLYTKDKFFKTIMESAAVSNGISADDYARKVFKVWANRLYKDKNFLYQAEYSTEILMDLKGVVIPLTSNWMAYGPYYPTYDQAKGMVKIQVDESLVPWNFERPVGSPWYENLDAAGLERMERSLSPVDFLDNASMTVAGFPEIGPAQAVGYNSNLTGITVDFGIGGVKTTYNFSTYAARPGTYRKSEYDNVSRARIDTRERLPETVNENIVHTVFTPQERNRY